MNIPQKANKVTPKISCERYKNHVRAFNNVYKNDYNAMKKVIVSQKTFQTTGKKSYSTGIINSNRGIGVTAPKKTAKSDLTFDQNLASNRSIDFCKECGDVGSNTLGKETVTNKPKSQSEESKLRYPLNKIIHNTTSGTKTSSDRPVSKRPLEQYYRNENFQQSSDSFYVTENLKKASLKTIVEHSENVTSLESDTVFEIYSNDSKEEIGFMDPDNKDNIKEIKEFRKQNYFECHSAKSRINSKGSVTNINNHKCVYRFYLNERLFPVPINNDYQENVRCTECHLPVQNNIQSSNINGTIQAKVKLNGEVQDVVLMLPVRKSLIVQERRKVLQNKKDYDYLYFGIVKLDSNGDSIFNRNLPTDSLALKYQKGYKELSSKEKFEYNSVARDDIIII